MSAARVLLASIKKTAADEPQPVWQLLEKDSVLNISVNR